MNFSEELFKKHKEECRKFPEWLVQLKEMAYQKFFEQGYPTNQEEEWRFTSVDQIKNSSFALPKELKLNGEIEKWIGKELFDYSPIRLVFLNGYFSREHSSLQGLSDGVKFESPISLFPLFPRGKNKEGEFSNDGLNAFYFLNTAFFSDGVHLTFSENVTLSKPVHLIYASVCEEEPFFVSPRIFISLGKNSKAEIIESFFGFDKGTNNYSFFNNVVREIFLGENAFLEHILFQNESSGSFHISNTFVQQQSNSKFSSYILTTAGKLVRNDLSVRLCGEGAESSLNGLYLVTEGAHVDNHTIVDHKQAHTFSRQLYKGILSGSSSAVFNGTIVVRPEAQKSDALQTNKNLLLSDQALVHSKPELKIFANDVKCKHGATVGQLDKNAIFYLRSRGISEEDSRKMLLYSFAQEAIAGISGSPLVDFVNEKLVMGLGS